MQVSEAEQTPLLLTDYATPKCGDPQDPGTESVSLNLHLDAGGEVWSSDQTDVCVPLSQQSRKKRDSVLAINAALLVI